jgi:hypothetical protein
MELIIFINRMIKEHENGIDKNCQLGLKILVEAFEIYI